VSAVTSRAPASARSWSPPSSGSAATSPRIQRVAEQVDLDIVVATGCCTYDGVPFLFHHRRPALDAALDTEVSDPMADMFVREITDGIAGTGVEAAFLSALSTSPA
jgi:phosphotriesterase-related protein